MWDLAIDAGSGDLMFGPSLDLLGSSGVELVNQRILTRCKIPRGTFIYDPDGTLGSRLMQVSGHALARQVQEVPPLVQEALEGMTDVQITDVNIQLQDQNVVSPIFEFFAWGEDASLRWGLDFTWGNVDQHSLESEDGLLKSIPMVEVRWKPTVPSPGDTSELQVDSTSSFDPSVTI